jgi:hypothetical protein
MISLICGLQIKGKHIKGIGLWWHDEVRAHNGGMRIDKKWKKKNKAAFDILNAKELLQKL